MLKEFKVCIPVVFTFDLPYILMVERFSSMFQHLVYLSPFGQNEMLVVEVDPDKLTKNLPTLLLRKRFGVL